MNCRGTKFRRRWRAPRSTTSGRSAPSPGISSASHSSRSRVRAGGHMKAALVLAQVLISFVIVAVTLPALMVFIPAAQDTALGPGLAVGLFVLVFIVLRLVWPRRRTH